MAAIVYDGVGGGGDLFAGIKFHILTRVPTRSTWMGLIEANGGEHVPLEKQADIVIGDHARKDQPPGSVSWTYIEQSVKRGRLENIKNHPAGSEERTVRQVGSAQITRTGRIPFSAEDDRILMEWCAAAERKGIPLKGNEIYKQLELKNNRHTFQSWRDRWVKYLQHRDRPAPPLENEEDEDGLLSPTTLSNQEPQARKKAVPRIAGRLPRTVAIISGARSIERKISPEREPALLSKMSRSSNAGPVKRNNSTEGAPVSAPLASSSAATPTRRNKFASKETTPETPIFAKPTESPIFTENEIRLLWDEYEDILNLDEGQIINAWMTWAADNPTHSAQEWCNQFKEIEAMKKARKDSNKAKSPKEPDRPTKPPSKPTILKQKSPREIKDSQGSSGQSLQSAKIPTKAIDPATVDETVFKSDLALFADSFDLEVDFKPVICGRTVPLFKLWQVVTSEEFGGFEAVNGGELWPKVARRLNFNDYKHNQAPNDLQTCYSEILAGFEDARKEYNEIGADITLTESQEEALIASQLGQTTVNKNENLEDTYEELVENYYEGSNEDSDDLDHPQVSPTLVLPSSSSKRSFGADHTRNDESFDKRQRIDKGKGKEREIPSTPESAVSKTQIPRPYYKSSVEDEELVVKPVKLSHSRPKPIVRNLEPETQDFHFHTELDYDNDGLVEVTSLPKQIVPRAQDHEQSISSITNTTREIRTSQAESSTQSQTGSQIEDVLREYIERQEALGYDADVVANALQYTTMDFGTCSAILEQLSKGQGIPDDMAGVWTDWDDRALEGSVRGDYRVVMKKHGHRRCIDRKRYLAESREEITEVE